MFTFPPGLSPAVCKWLLLSAFLGVSSLTRDEATRFAVGLQRQLEAEQHRLQPTSGEDLPSDEQVSDRVSEQSTPVQQHPADEASPGDMDEDEGEWWTWNGYTLEELRLMGIRIT